MPSSFEKQKLLADVLQDGNYEQFRRDLLRQTRQEFRRQHRRRARGALPWLALAATLLLGMFLGQRYLPQGSSLRTKTMTAQLPAMVPVESGGAASSASPSDPAALEELAPPVVEPAPVFEIVQTSPLPESAVIRSVAQRSLIVTTDPRGLPPHLIVQTTEPTETVTDDQLLALFPNRPAGLIQLPTDEKLFVLGPPRE